TNDSLVVAVAAILQEGRYGPRVTRSLSASSSIHFPSAVCRCDRGLGAGRARVEGTRSREPALQRGTGAHSRRGLTVRDPDPPFPCQPDGHTAPEYHRPFANHRLQWVRGTQSHSWGRYRHGPRVTDLPGRYGLYGRGVHRSRRKALSRVLRVRLTG